MKKSLALGMAGVVMALGLSAYPTTVEAHADPVSAVGDGPGPMADIVCRTLDGDPTVQGVRQMMVNYTGFMINRNLAWDTILNGVVWDCPQHADLLKDYAQFYGQYH